MAKKEIAPTGVPAPAEASIAYRSIIKYNLQSNQSQAALNARLGVR